ncbi:DUF2975 domain-containing protein [Clostridium ljungdahlii]|uniref:DUF2975 domain-containing protein n=1 Tax=Clostridium ljungdahlii TaxID=1538 RepID=A0A168M296_9CLOT|nr:DUF2975 domain-containing protein [Clostridium ljungdahlii]OAA84011.1 hypothetical protein WY13_03140 [Clostridium ljungdahlii]
MFCKRINLMEKLIVRFNGEKNFIISFLNVILNIAFVMSLICLICFFPFPLLVTLPVYAHTKLYITIKYCIFSELNVLMVSFIIYELKNIIERIRKDKIFIIENANGFTKTGVYVFLWGIVRQINYIVNGHYGMLFRFDNDGNLDIDIFIFIIIACISLVIGEVLRKAVKIKNENDLTI